MATVVFYLFLGCFGLFIFATWQAFQLRKVFLSKSWNWYAAAYLIGLAGLAFIAYLYIVAFTTRQQTATPITTGLILRMVIVFGSWYGFLICKIIGNHKLHKSLQKFTKNRAKDSSKPPKQ